jgi:CRP-like cAMP-binding protein
VSEPPSQGASSWRHRLRQFSAGEVIFHEGDVGHEMYLIQEGQVEILRLGSDGPQRLALLEKGDFFGEMAILDELPRTATVAAVSEARLVEINGGTFDEMLRANPEIAIRIMRKLSLRVRQADEQLGLAPTEASSGRLAEAPTAEPPTRAGQMIHLASGTRLEVEGGDTITIGRRDPVTGIRPSVDLTELDQERSVSRRHAKLERRGRRLYLVEDLGTTNGTFVNGERIAPGEPVEVGTGDLLRFGLVELTYEGT